MAKRLEVYPSDELQSALDRWRFLQPGVPSRAEAARRLLGLALNAEIERASQVEGKKDG